MEKVDIVIIGAGVVGLAIAHELAVSNNKLVAVLEQNKKFGQETSSRNSEVIHSGLYYPPEMLKSRLCVQGNPLMYDYCRHYGVTHHQCGKIILADSEEQSSQLEALCQAAAANVVETRLLSAREVKIMEPDVKAWAGLYVPASGMVDSHQLMQALFFQGREQGVVFVFDSPVKALTRAAGGYILETSKETIWAEQVINSAGLGAEKIAASLGLDTIAAGYHITPCKGEYFRIKRRLGVKHLLYPLPGKNSLGVHLSMDRAGNLRLGPNAIYVKEIDYRVDEAHRKEFFQAAQTFLPALQEEDLEPDFAGIRPKLQEEGEDVRDFVIQEEAGPGYPGFINLIGIESPGLTSCLAIAELVEQML